jgi:hypothetical protein
MRDLKRIGEGAPVTPLAQTVYVLVQYKAEVLGAFLSEREAEEFAKVHELPEQAQHDGGHWKIAKREVHIA